MILIFVSFGGIHDQADESEYTEYIHIVFNHWPLWSRLNEAFDYDGTLSKEDRVCLLHVFLEELAPYNVRLDVLFIQVALKFIIFLLRFI